MPYFCGGCDLGRGEERETFPAGPCPKCGVSTVVWYAPGKEFYIRVGRRVSRSLIPGTRKWVSKSIGEESLFRATGRMHYIERLIDRVQGEYHERIIDKETGEVVREVHEPLKEHRNRGSAKKKSDQPDSAT